MTPYKLPPVDPNRAPDDAEPFGGEIFGTHRLDATLRSEEGGEAAKTFADEPLSAPPSDESIGVA